MHVSVASRPEHASKPITERGSRVTPGPSWLIILISFVAFTLRIHDLNHESLLFDEALSFTFATTPLESMYQFLAAKDIHPPLYELLLHGWLPLAGSTAFALRFLALLPGVLAVPMTYRLATYLVGQVKRYPGVRPPPQQTLSNMLGASLRAGAGYVALTGYLAAFLTATSLLLIHNSQMNRDYSLLVLAVLVATYAFARLALMEQPRRRDVVLSGLALAIGGYVHYLALLVFPVQLLFTLFSTYGRRRVRSVALSWLVAVVAYLPWLPGAAQQLFRLQSMPDFFQGTLNMGGTLRQFVAANLSAGVVAQTRLPYIVGALTLLVVAGLAFGFRRLQRADRRRTGAFLLVLSLVVPVGITLAVMWRNPKYADRYFIASVPFVFLIIDAAVLALVQSIAALPWRVRHLRLVGQVLIGIVLALVCGGTLVQASHPYAAATSQNEDARGAVQYIREQHQLGDAIFLVQDWSPLFSYYAGTTLGRQHIDWEGVDPFFNNETTVAGLNRVASGHTRLWLVEWHTNWADPSGFTKGQLEQHADQVGERRDFKGYSVTLYHLWAGETFTTAPNARTATSVLLGDAVLFKGGRVREQSRHPSDADVRLDTWWELVAPVDDPGMTITVSLMQGTTLWGHRDYSLSYPRSNATTWGVGTKAWRYIDVNPLPGTPPGDYDVRVNLYSPAKGKIIGSLTPVDTVHLDPPEHVFQPGQVAALASQRVDDQQKGVARLLGYTVASSTNIVAGQKVPITLFWEAVEQPKGPEGATLLLQDSRGTTVASSNQPIVQGYSFERWHQGDVYRDQRLLSLPGTVASGTYRLMTKTSSSDLVTLASMTVQGREHAMTPPSPPQRQLAAAFGKVATLHGMDIDASKAQPGGSLGITLYWQSLGISEISYKVFVHVLADNGDIGGRQDDSYPAQGNSPTTSWIAGEWTVDKHDVPLPPTTPPGKYRISVGMYDLQSGQRVALPDGRTEFSAGDVEVR